MARSRLYVYICVGLMALPHLAAAVEPLAAATPADRADEAAETADVDAAMTTDPVDLRIVDSQVVAQITGRDSPNDTATRWDIYGTDLGHMFWHRDKLHMVFGDTFGPKGMFHRKNWRSNTMAVIADPDPRNGLPIETMITGPDGAAKELIASRKVDGEEMTVIPTYGVSLGERMYLHYMSVRHWADPGRWEVGHSGLSYSDDDGRTWVVPEEAVWPPHSGFEQVAFVLEDTVLYTFGIPEGRFGDVRLRRVAPERILEPDAYEYWDGKQWVGELTEAAPLVAAPVGELSVAWSAANGRWMMMYLDPARKAVVLRTAPRLTGPWGEAHLVLSAQDYPGLYAPFIVPGSGIGADLYYTLSLWEPYNVFLMHTSLEWKGLVTAGTPGEAGTDEVGGTTGDEPDQEPRSIE